MMDLKQNIKIMNLIMGKNIDNTGYLKETALITLGYPN